ncbi:MULTISPECIES: hypothetical protein [Bacillales]|nr:MULTISPECIES: hypothetical protein [Bacillales]HZG10947.1 hypothetical protein [Kurthia gibsonii]
MEAVLMNTVCDTIIKISGDLNTTGYVCPFSKEEYRNRSFFKPIFR